MPSEKRARQRAAREAKRAAEARRRRRRTLLRRGAVVLVVAVVVVGSVYLITKPGPSKPAAETPTSLAVKAGCPQSPTTRVNDLSWKSPPKVTIDTSKTYTATLKTTLGDIVISLMAKQAPVTVNNFVFLAQHSFYKCVIFHRVVTGFVDQTGDPTGTGSGGPGYKFANENIPTAYATGDVAMANSGGTDTNGSQFFLVVPGGAQTLDSDLSQGDQYSLFGTITSGLKVAEAINADGSTSGTPKVVERILSVKITES